MDVLNGLRQPQKTIPSKYFYDARGCHLFDQICELPEYYLTRTELQIMQRNAKEMAIRLGKDAVVVEFGCGSSQKTPLLLDELETPAAYVPLDIAIEHLQDSATALRQRYPRLSVLPVAADFTTRFELPADIPADARSIYFPGSTIGNLQPDDAVQLLRRVPNITHGGGMLLGIDLVKEFGVLKAAYNDSRGVTEQFNLNLLQRLNRELGATFQLADFRHQADFNRSHQRIEMHLVSQCDQQPLIDGIPISIRKGETIRTELSHKYELETFSQLAQLAGLNIQSAWTDDRDWFAVLWLTPIEPIRETRRYHEMGGSEPSDSRE